MINPENNSLLGPALPQRLLYLQEVTLIYTMLKEYFFASARRELLKPVYTSSKNWPTHTPSWDSQDTQPTLIEFPVQITSILNGQPVE